MRITQSLALSLILSSAVVIGGFGWMQLSKEREDLTDVATRDMVVLATAVRSATETALKYNVTLDITSLLEQLELREPSLDVFVFDENGNLADSSIGSSANLSIAQDLARNIVATSALHVELLPDIGIVAVAPIRGHDRSSGAQLSGGLVIVRPANELHADLESESQSLLSSVVLLVAALTCVSWLVIHHQLHKPMSRLVATVRRIGGGDLSTRAGIEGRNEIAEIARELDLMSSALEDANHRAAAMAETQRQLQSDLQRANKLATIGELAATLAHEIGSPLQVLSGRARSLALSDQLSEKERRSAEILVEQTDRIAGLVQRILGFARRKPSVTDNMDVREVARNVTEVLSLEARRKGVRFEINTAQVPTVRADADQVQQVMFNLLQNALKASDRNGIVQISIDRSSFARPGSSSDQQSVAITVEDNGHGIPDDVMDRLFEPFFSSWNNGQGSSGTGLGLTVVKSLMDEHGGVVIASKSHTGTGARFTVHFPINNPPSGFDSEAP